MACYNPTNAAILKVGNKMKVVFPNQALYLEHAHTEAFWKIAKHVSIPCGKCIGCKLSDAKEWASRCMLEASMNVFNEMLTLTYNDENLPHSIDKRTGEVVETLRRKDYTDFIKRLRIYWKRHNLPGTIKEKYCGEYGDTSGRPHYHAILFDFFVPDKVYHGKNENGYEIYTSKIIEEIWGKGFITLNEVNYETCAYVSRYVMKKAKIVDKNFYLDQGKEPEFTGQSLRPGIASGYYDLKKNTIYETDEIFLPSQNGVKAFTPPRYFDKKYQQENPQKMEKIKNERIDKADLAGDMELIKTDLINPEYIKLKKETKENQIRSLRRNL